MCSAWRNVWRNRRRTLITLAALSLGCAAIVAIQLSPENGTVSSKNATLNVAGPCACGAAISAARHGAKVAIVHERPIRPADSSHSGFMLLGIAAYVIGSLLTSSQPGVRSERTTSVTCSRIREIASPPARAARKPTPIVLSVES